MKAGVDDYLVDHGPEALEELISQAWAPDPSWNDTETEVWWRLRSVGPDSRTFDKLKALCGLAPLLAKLDHVEAALLLEAMRGRLKLRAKDLADLERDIKAARKALESKGKRERQAPELEDIEEARRLHPAVDFANDHMTIGFRIPLKDGEEGLLLLISDGQGVWVEINPDCVDLGGQTYTVTDWRSVSRLEDVWDLQKVKDFLSNPTKPNVLCIQIKEELRRYLDLPEEAYGLLAAWIVGTYFAHLFSAFPFLNPSGPKETGKSKTLEALRFTCFNGWKGRDITVAALGDTLEGQRGTVLIDQAEKLAERQEGNVNLVGLLADSYKKAGGFRRVVETSKNGRRVVEFRTYGPKAFASTKRLDPDLEDRCIKIPMTRTRKRLPDLEGWEPVWGELRDSLYRFALAEFKNVQEAYRRIEGDGTRIGELWRPLGAVLAVLQVAEDELAEIWEMFTTQARETRHEPTSWEVALLEALKTRAESEDADFEMTPAEIISDMGFKDEEARPGAKWIGDTLSGFNLYLKKTRPRVDGRQVTAYQFSQKIIIDLCSRYLRSDDGENDESFFKDTPPNDVHNVHITEKINHKEDLRCAGEKPCSRTDVHNVQECSRTEKDSCTVQADENIEEIISVHDVHENQGGIEEIFLPFLSGAEVDL